MSFEHRLRVRFQDVDAARLVFFAKFFDYAHDAYEEWLHGVGQPLHEILNAGEIGTPLVRVEADFERPARHGDELLVRLRGIDIGGTSAVFVWAIHAADGGERLAEVRMKHVCIDLEKFKSCPWPDALRTALVAAGPVED